MSNQSAADVAVLIPSYQPDAKLPPYVQALREAGFATIVIVDDGSGDAYTPIFESLAAPGDETVHVLRYTPNHGKGYALRMAEALHADGTGLLLGSRDFSQAHVPAKSRMGNRITTAVFLLLYGKLVRDTQTGLRGFSRELMARFVQTRGDRYEYEMNQLIDCATERIPIRALPIETVYENNNEGSHFHPVRDSFRIYQVIFARFMRFIAASMICFLVDYGLYLLLNNLFRTHVPSLNQYVSFLPFRIIARIGLAAVLARIVSSVLNFILNKKLVFAYRARVSGSFARYAATVVFIVALSAWLTSSLHVWFGWSDNIVKMPVDILLFFLSYYLQRRWVFGGKGERVPQASAPSSDL